MPGCGALTNKTYCESHQNKENKRESASRRGYDRHWQRARELYLQSNAVCVECLSDGKIEAATVVDHIVPHKGDKRLFWNQGNWQALCKRCHDRKTATNDGGFGR